MTCEIIVHYLKLFIRIKKKTTLLEDLSHLYYILQDFF